MKQPFEKYSKLTNFIQIIGNGGKLSNSEWSQFLEQINYLCNRIEGAENDLEISNGEFNNFNDWLNERDTTRNIYSEFLSLSKNS